MKIIDTVHIKRVKKRKRWTSGPEPEDRILFKGVVVLELTGIDVGMDEKAQVVLIVYAGTKYQICNFSQRTFSDIV